VHLYLFLPLNRGWHHGTTWSLVFYFLPSSSPLPPPLPSTPIAGSGRKGAYSTALHHTVLCYSACHPACIPSGAPHGVFLMEGLAPLPTSNSFLRPPSAYLVQTFYPANIICQLKFYTVSSELTRAGRAALEPPMAVPDLSGDKNEAAWLYESCCEDDEAPFKFTRDNISIPKTGGDEQRVPGCG
jgi:hypothetical protein